MTHTQQAPQTWSLLAGSICSLVLTMGIARFALTPLLPAMQAETGLGDDGAGFLAAFNYAGYLMGALMASRLKDPETKIFYYRWGLILAVATTALMALTSSIIFWSSLRFVSGLSSAAGMVICTSLMMDHLKKSGQSDLIGVHFAGVGLGVIVSGSLLSGLEAQLGWDGAWMVIGAVGLVFALPAYFWVHAKGLTVAQMAPEQAVSIKSRTISCLLISYCFAGATFSTGTTFIISIMAETPALADSRNLAWVLVGVALAPSCYLWMKAAIIYGDFKSLTAAFLIQAIGCALPVLYPHSATALIGGFMFGACFMGIVTVVIALGGKLSPHNPSALIGILVVSYGVGQITGPLLTGLVMEQTQLSSLGLWSAALCSLISIVFLIGAKCFENSKKQENQPCLS